MLEYWYISSNYKSEYKIKEIVQNKQQKTPKTELLRIVGNLSVDVVCLTWQLLYEVNDKE